MSTIQSKKASSGLEIAILLTIAGGALDAYTFACRGGVFANAQTGNIIRLGIFLANHQYQECLVFLISIIAFGLGTLCALLIQNNFHKIRKKSARRVVLLMEIVIVLIVSRIPQDKIQNIIANTLVSFMAAMQMEAFKVFSGQAITTTVCTGNYRKFIECLYLGINTHDHQTRLISYQYAMIVIFFILGGWIGMKAAVIIGIKSILFELVWLLPVFLIITIKFDYHNKN